MECVFRLIKWANNWQSFGMNLTITIPTQVILNDRHEWMHEMDASRIFVAVDSWSVVLIFTCIYSICSCLFQITVHMFLDHNISHSTWFWDCNVCPFSLLPCLFLCRLKWRWAQNHQDHSWMCCRDICLRLFNKFSAYFSHQERKQKNIFTKRIKKGYLPIFHSRVIAAELASTLA